MALLDVLKDKYGSDFHPAMLLAQVIEDVNADIKLRVDCAKSLMPFIEATKKAVEVRGELKSDFGVLRVSMFREIVADEVVKEAEDTSTEVPA